MRKKHHNQIRRQHHSWDSVWSFYNAVLCHFILWGHSHTRPYRGEKCGLGQVSTICLRDQSTAAKVEVC